MLKKTVYHALLLPLYVYRYLISPIIGPHCRFAPTCSEYAIESIHKHGLIKGGKLTMKRIAKCHHRGGNGYDPVP